MSCTTPHFYERLLPVNPNETETRGEASFFFYPTRKFRTRFADSFAGELNLLHNPTNQPEAELETLPSACRRAERCQRAGG